MTLAAREGEVKFSVTDDPLTVDDLPLIKTVAVTHSSSRPVYKLHAIPAPTSPPQ